MKRWIVCCGLLWAAMGSQTSAAEPVGMVLDVVGAVQFVKPTVQDVHLFTTLEPGVQIGLGRGARLVATFYARGAELSFLGPARLKVGEEGIEMIYGLNPQERALHPQDVVAASQGITRRQQQAAISMRNIDPLVSPVHQGAVRETTPEFEYSGVTEGLFLAVFDRDAKLVVRAPLAAGGSLRLAADQALRRGESYSWTLIEDDGTPKTVKRKVFRVLQEDEVALVDARRPPAEATVAQWALYAGLLESLWLRTEAKAVWARLARARPNDPTLARFAQ